jgi:hypothetical protein
MDGLLLLVITIGSLLVTLVAFLGTFDYIYPVSDAKLGGIYPSRGHKNSDNHSYR